MFFLFFFRCTVGNLAGRVQWTSDGFALGYDPSMIKNYCERCSLSGDHRKGEFHLLVKDITLNKDNHFECQVSPDSTNSHKGLRAVADIQVLGEMVFIFS